MANEELRYDFVGNDRISGTSASVARGLGNVADESKNTQRQLRALDGELQRLNKTKTEFAKSFTKTGDLGILKDINRVDKDIKAFSKIRDILAAEGGKAAIGFGAQFAAMLPRSLGKLGPVGAIVGTALVAGMVPVIATTLGAAVIGAGGGLGIVGGIVAAAQDSRVKSAATSLKEEFGLIFRDAAKPFVPAVLNSLKIVRGAFPQLRKDLSSIFKNSAPLLAPLTTGVTSAITSITSGLSKLLASSGARKVFNELGLLVTRVGAAIGRMFERLSDDGDEAAGAIRFLGNVIVGVIEGLTTFIEIGSAVYRTFIDMALGAAEFGAAINGWMPILGKHAKENRDRLLDIKAAMDQNVTSAEDVTEALAPASVGYQSMADAATNAARAAELLNDTTATLIGTMLGVDEASLAAKQGYADLMVELKNGKRSLDINTQAGRDNVSAILDQVGKWEQLRQANIDGGMAVDDANGLFYDQVSALQATMTKMGFAREDINKLLEKYKKIPASKKTDIKANTKPAIEAINTFKTKLNGIDGKTVNTYVKVTTIGDTDHISTNTGGGRMKRASGGPVFVGQTYQVAENGPELFTPRQNGWISNAKDTKNMMAGSASNVTLTINNPVFPSVNSPSDFIRELKRDIRTLYNGDVQLALGS